MAKLCVEMVLSRVGHSCFHAHVGPTCRQVLQISLRGGRLIQVMRVLSWASEWRNSELGALSLRDRISSKETLVNITGRRIRGERA